MMGGLGEGIAILGLILLVGKVWAGWRILERLQLNKFAAFAFLFPIIGEAILLWWLAFARWPRDEAAGAAADGDANDPADLWSPGQVGSTDMTVSEERRPPTKT